LLFNVHQSLTHKGFPPNFIVQLCPTKYTEIRYQVGNQTVTENSEMGKLSATEIRNARVKDSTWFLDDGDGLRLRISPDGEKAWQVRYTVMGFKPPEAAPAQTNAKAQDDSEASKKQRREVAPQTGARTITLARHYGPKTDAAHLSLDGARDQARIIRALARDGKDFQQIRRDEIEAEKKERALKQAQALTVRDLFDTWHAEISVKRGKTGRKDGGAEVKRALEKDVMPHLGTTLLTALTRDAVLKTMRRISDRGHNRLAVIVLRDFKQMLRYGDTHQPWKRLLVECDALAIDDESVVRGEYDNVRTRALEESEITKLKTLLPVSGMTGVVQAAIWVMLSVGTRVGETVATEWKHIDFDTRTWHIPKENTKTQTAMKVFLSDFTLAIFQALHKARMAREEEERSDWVFPSRTSRLKPLDGQTVGKALNDRQRPDGKPIKGRTESVNALVLPGGVWKCHDLRRTAGTLMQKCGVSPETIHKCLNHAPATKLDQIYLQYDYSEEMAAAWEKLGERLGILLSHNVIPVDFKQAG
jgi:integrase